MRFAPQRGNFAPSSLRGLAEALVPHPRCHFLSLNYVPFWPAATVTPRDMVEALYYDNSMLASREQWLSGRLIASHAHIQLENTDEPSVLQSVEESLAQVHAATTSINAAAPGGSSSADNDNRFMWPWHVEPIESSSASGSSVVVPWRVDRVEDNAKHSFGRWHSHAGCDDDDEEADGEELPTLARARTVAGSAVQGSLPRGSATLVSNSTSIRHSFEVACGLFDAMFRRKAFIYGYAHNAAREPSMLCV
jgi:hypothetical protein